MKKQTAVEYIQENFSMNKTLGEIKIIIATAKEMDSIEKHAEYMRGWKDGYSCKSINKEMK